MVSKILIMLAIKLILLAITSASQHKSGAPLARENSAFLEELSDGNGDDHDSNLPEEMAQHKEGENAEIDEAMNPEQQQGSKPTEEFDPAQPSMNELDDVDGGEDNHFLNDVNDGRLFLDDGNGNDTTFDVGLDKRNADGAACQIKVLSVAYSSLIPLGKYFFFDSRNITKCYPKWTHGSSKTIDVSNGRKSGTEKVIVWNAKPWNDNLHSWGIAHGRFQKGAKAGDWQTGAIIQQQEVGGSKWVITSEGTNADRCNLEVKTSNIFGAGTDAIVKVIITANDTDGNTVYCGYYNIHADKDGQLEENGEDEYEFECGKAQKIEKIVSIDIWHNGFYRFPFSDDSPWHLDWISVSCGSAEKTFKFNSWIKKRVPKTHNGDKPGASTLVNCPEDKDKLCGCQHNLNCIWR